MTRHSGKRSASRIVAVQNKRDSGQARMTNRILGILIIILGLILFIFPTVFKNFSITKNIQKIDLKTTKKVSSKSIEPIKIDNKLLSEKEQSEPPSRVVIPALKVDLPIVEAKVINGLWELSETSASHGVGSANPGSLGNNVIFAHARDGLFGPLRNLKQNDIIYILTKDRWYKYEVKETKLVDPDETQVVTSTEDETLTLYTCDGFLDSKRLIIIAKPQK